MKRIIFLLLLIVPVLMRVSAVPACPEPYTATNADGTTVTIILHGDEYYNYLTTIDGYTVMREGGNYVYATMSGNRLVSSGVIAHNEPTRTGNERALLASLRKGLTDSGEVSRAKRARQQRDAVMAVPPGARRSAAAEGFRGLIILMNYNDLTFENEDINSFIDQMANTTGYTGYDSSEYGTFTGSVRDYFNDNSMGQFDPHFDVVGPITVDFSCLDGRNKSANAFIDILNNHIYQDYGINIWDYDNDGDGVVDLIYFIVAGYGSNYSGNNENYLWPHATYFINSSTGEKLVNIACSTEFYGWEDPEYVHMPDGIGTICHEFSHTLGVMDLYDTDYEENGQSLHPGKWDIMAGGSYFNYSRTPCGYSLYDRYAMGFAQPTVITADGQYTLGAIGDTNEGFIIETPNSKEKFLLENRQITSKWDAYLPGHGMIVARMDSTDTEIWTTNKINCDATHNYYELLRAGGSTEGNSDSDPFPGTSAVTAISGSDSSVPNLLTWDGQANKCSISDIIENGSDVSFTVSGFTRNLPLKICGHQLTTATDMEEFNALLRSEKKLSYGSLDYDNETRTLTLTNLRLADTRVTSTIIYSPALTGLAIDGLTDTLHIVVNGNTLIGNTYRGGVALGLNGTYAKIEGEGQLACLGTGTNGYGIALANSTIDINGRADLRSVGTYGLYCINGKAGFLIHDNDYGRPAKAILQGSSGAARGITFKLSDGYYVSTPEGAKVDILGRLVSSSGTVIKDEPVVIEQSRLPIAIHGSPIYANWNENTWTQTKDLMKANGTLNEDGDIRYDVATHTLTLDNAKFTYNDTEHNYGIISNGYGDSDHDCFVYGYNDFKLNIIGDCSFNLGGETLAALVSYAGTTSITGDGTLTLNNSGENYIFILRGGSTLNLNGPVITSESNTISCAVRGHSTAVLNINAGGLTVTTPRSIPFADMGAVNLNNGFAIIQPEGAYIGEMIISDRNRGYGVILPNGEIFGGGTLVIAIPEAQELPGDVNNDGSVNAGDVSAIYNVMLGVETNEDIIRRANVNGDDTVNAGDVSLVYQYMLGN